MGARIETRVFDDGETLAAGVADAFIAAAAATSHRPFAVALAGGSTPKRLYELLAAPPRRERVRWENVEMFFGDERSVPPEHPDSNYGMAKRALLDHVPCTAHRMAAEHDDAAGYTRVLAQRIERRRDGFPVFDLVFLGMGDDGHTASLFPGTAALAERTAWVVMNDVPQLHTRRMTLTYSVLNAADRVWMTIAGAGKSTIVAECLAAAARGETPWPILGVRPTAGELIWFLDKAAAGPTA